MKQNQTLSIVVVVMLIGLGISFGVLKMNRPEVSTPQPPFYESIFVAKNETYEIEGKIVTLKDGVSETKVFPDSATKVTTRYFGNDAHGDLNNNGTVDRAFLLTQNTGGTGTFYYVVAVLRQAHGYKTTNTVLLGDRIAPQSTEISGGELRVNYAERKVDEPMTAQPSVGVTKIFKVRADSTLVEVKK